MPKKTLRFIKGFLSCWFLGIVIMVVAGGILWLGCTYSHVIVLVLKAFLNVAAVFTVATIPAIVGWIVKHMWDEYHISKRRREES